MNLTAIILTKNEEAHIERAIRSLSGIANSVLVVDSGSSDRTCELAKELGANVLYNRWKNYSSQFNWALEQIPESSEWVLRLDADEIVTEELKKDIISCLPKIEPEVKGIYVPRRMNFMGSAIRWGGVFPVHVLRIFRPNSGRCEDRWMDEHIKVRGDTKKFTGEIIDDNLNSLSWWTDKHNAYASREVVDLLNLEYGFSPHDTVADLRGGNQAGVKRWIKEKLYSRLPIGGRSFIYFLYRYVIRLGFLDGWGGAAFHVLQGFWYRYLVDMKLIEVKDHMIKHNACATKAIEEVLNIKVSKHPTS